VGATQVTMALLCSCGIDASREKLLVSNSRMAGQDFPQFVATCVAPTKDPHGKLLSA
jgi:hypothetical protein